MNIFQLKSFYCYNKSVRIKATLFLMIFLFGGFNLSAQKERNIKLKIETGILWDWVYGKVYGSGPFLNVEPKLKTSKNTLIGLRFGAAFNTQAIKNADPLQFYIDQNFSSGNKAISFIPTFDYYFNKNKSRPYLGLGVGYYFLTTSKRAFINGNTSNELKLNVNNKMGFLVRGGFDLPKVIVRRLDLSKFSLGLEFNYIPKGDIETPNGQIVGTMDNSNVAFSIGWILKNRRRSK